MLRIYGRGRSCMHTLTRVSHHWLMPFTSLLIAFCAAWIYFFILQKECLGFFFSRNSRDGTAPSPKKENVKINKTKLYIPRCSFKTMHQIWKQPRGKVRGWWFYNPSNQRTGPGESQESEDEFQQLPWGATSLVARWLRIHLQAQGTRVWSLVWEDHMPSGN